MISFDFNKTLEKLNPKKLKDTFEKIESVKYEAVNTGFLKSYINNYVDKSWNNSYIKPIMEKVSKIQHERASLIIIAEATAISALKSVIEPLETGANKIYYLGDGLSANGLFNILNEINDRDIYLYVIANSLQKPEIGAHFRVLKHLLYKKYNKVEAANHIIITTSEAEELNKNLTYKDYFIIPFDGDIPLEFIAFTPVAFLPFYFAGIEIQKLYEGANKVLRSLEDDEDNTLEEYVAIRWLALQEGIEVENICTFEPKLESLCEWRGRLPGNDMIYHGYALYLRDHDNLKYYHTKYKNKIMETFINIKVPTVDIVVRPEIQGNDGLNFLDNISFNELNKIQCDKLIEDHRKDGMFINTIDCRRLSAVNLGSMIFYFMVAGIIVNKIITKFSGK